VTIAPLVHKILLGAAASLLDIARATLLPGAWPILRGALGPVLERLKERLGGQDVTSSSELAGKAADAFAADEHLQEVLRSALVEQLDKIVQSQQGMNDDVHTLMAIVSGNEALLTEIVGGVGPIEDHLQATTATRGVLCGTSPGTVRSSRRKSDERSHPSLVAGAGRHQPRCCPRTSSTAE
jgi:hypothetical protein